ncbi:unnamed protein product, partial [Hapterophycus canaliculatus]
MDVESIASELRGSRRKLPFTAREGCPEASVDRIRSSVASKWITSVDVSSRMAPRRPQRPLTRHIFRGAGPVIGGDAVPSWASGNPYASPFPRARTWTCDANVQGLSGRRPPSGWNEEAKQLEATLAERQKRVSAKELYCQLVNATALEREKRAAPKLSSPTSPPTERLGYDGDSPEDAPPSHEFRPGAREKPAHKDDTEHQVFTANESSRIPQKPSSSPNNQEAEGDEKLHHKHSLLGIRPNASICLPDKAVREEERAQSKPQQGRHPCSETQPAPIADGDTSATCGLPSKTSQLATTLCSQLSTLVDDAYHASNNSEGLLRSSRCCSMSASDSSSSSGSSVSMGSDEGHSSYEGDSDENATGILEDLTEGIDSWLEDVDGAGREAFFALFKYDATPQFCRPSLEVIGRHGIGSNFVDGNPNIKYLPQRPIELHQISSPQPPPASPSPKVAVRRRPAHPAAMISSIPQRPKTASTAMGKAPTSTAANDKVQVSLATKAQSPSLKIDQVRQPITEEDSKRGVVPGQPSTATGVARGRPHSSPAVRSGLVVGSGEGKVADPSNKRWSPERSPTRQGMPKGADLRGGRAQVEGNKLNPPRLKRPQTADGRDIEVTRHKNPRLDDPGDPVMIAQRMMKRPLSPRRDYLMRCAERQLMPLPVINRALRIDPSTPRSDPTTVNKNSQARATADEGMEDIRITSAKEGGIHEGCLVLRHYYLGSARAKCLESAITSVPVALREVELVDSGLDGLAAEALLGVLLRRVGTICKLDLSRNRIGVQGAAGLARFIANKDCKLRFLKLDGNKAGDQAITAVLKALVKRQPPLSYLGLSDNRLTLKTMQDCAGPLLTGGLSILHLDLGWNHLNQHAVEELSDALAWNKSITKMSLRFNNSGEGIHALAEALLNNNTLTSLDLTANQASLKEDVRWRGAIALSAAVGASASIRRVALRDNPIGTAAGLYMGITLARKSGIACLIDIKGCTCFSDKTDIWSGMNARMRAARAARIAMVRARNAGIRARKRTKTSKKDKRASPGIAGKSPAADGSGDDGKKGKKTPPAKNTPPPLPPPTRPDDQLFWLDLTIDRKWDLKLNRPFDRAILGEA